MKEITMTGLILCFLQFTFAQTATISGTAEVCLNAAEPAIIFTGSGGVTPYTFYYNIDGGNTLSVTSSGNNATIDCPTSNTGSFTYYLLSVTDANSSSQLQSGSATIMVNPLPTATISGSTTLCVNDANPTITFTGANGTAQYTFTYNINNGASQTVVSTGNTATVSVPTTSAGTFIYNLISVEDASTTQCTQNQSGSVIVIVEDCAGIEENEWDPVSIYPLPSSGIVNLKSDSKIENIVLLDMEGRKLDELQPYESICSIDISNLMEGTYVIQITSGNQIITKRIQKVD